MGTINRLCDPMGAAIYDYYKKDDEWNKKLQQMNDYNKREVDSQLQGRD